MSIASKYGESYPRQHIISPTEKRVCVKTTRYLLKKLAHMSHAVEVVSDVKPTIIRNQLGDDYNEESKLAWEKIVQKWVNQQSKDFSTQYSVGDFTHDGSQ